MNTHNAIDENSSSGAKDVHITSSEITKVLIIAAPTLAVTSHFINRPLKISNCLKIVK
ncbi:hypothetical protein V6260_00730 [Pseudoalteromonas aliena]|uniref:hypothetical protein n=1 Tax=Pseudoalteromonas aliena TaxID=247523 RepID=UPI00311E3685